MYLYIIKIIYKYIYFFSSKYFLKYGQYRLKLKTFKLPNNVLLLIIIIYKNNIMKFK